MKSDNEGGIYLDEKTDPEAVEAISDKNDPAAVQVVTDEEKLVEDDKILARVNHTSVENFMKLEKLREEKLLKALQEKSLK